MKFAYFILPVAAVLLAGCSSNLLGGGSSVPTETQQVSVNNELALPPDLALRAPGTGAPAYKAPTQDAVYSDTPAPAPKPMVTRPSPVQAAYDKYNISMTKPDGTPKKQWELREELRQAVLAEKRRKNPNYGTVFNTTDLFKDQ